MRCGESCCVQVDVCLYNVKPSRLPGRVFCLLLEAETTEAPLHRGQTKVTELNTLRDHCAKTLCSLWLKTIALVSIP